MSDVAAAFVLGSLLWFIGGAGVIAGFVSGWTLFVPFAAVLIGLGVSYCLAGIIWAAQANSGPGSARHPARWSRVRAS